VADVEVKVDVEVGAVVTVVDGGLVVVVVAVADEPTVVDVVGFVSDEQAATAANIATTNMMVVRRALTDASPVDPRSRGEFGGCGFVDHPCDLGLAFHDPGGGESFLSFNGFQHLTQGGSLRRSSHQEEHPAGAVEELESRRQAVSVQTRHMVGYEPPMGWGVEGRCTGKQGGGVAVVAHAEEDQIGPPRGVDRAKVGFVVGGGIGRREPGRPAGPEKAGIDVIHQQFCCHPSVAVLVLVGHPALVRHPGVDPAPIDL
jgi:hypothetical protein